MLFHVVAKDCFCLRYMVRVGDHDLDSDEDDQYAVNVLISEKIVYEKYDKSSHIGDIAILKLQEAVPLTCK